MLIAPTVGILQLPYAEPIPEDVDFVAEILRDVLDQTSVVAKRLRMDAKLGRIIFVGKNHEEPAWITDAKRLGWTASSISPSAGARESALTYEAKIDPRAVVASNAEILVILGADKLTKDSPLLGNLLPEAHVVTRKSSPPRYWYLDKAELHNESHADFCRAIQNLVSGTDTRVIKPEIERIEQPQRSFSFGGIFPAMVRLLSRTPHRVTFLFKRFSEIETESLIFGDQSYLRRTTVSVLSEARNCIAPAFVRHDETALYHGDRYRSSILLGLFFTLIAFLALTFGHFSTSWSFALRIGEIAALFAILVMVIAERGLGMHRKWLINRMIAELLRPTQYLLALWLQTSRGFNYPERPPHLSSAIAYQRLVIRAAGPLSFHIDQEYLDEMRHVILDLLSNQIKWHKLNADTNQRCLRAFVRANKVFFAFLLTAGVLSWAPPAGSFWSDLCFVAASICTLCISISGACIHYFSFGQIAERSELSLRRYQILHDHVATLGPNVTYAEIKLWMQSTTDVMADEQLDWFRQTSRLRALF